MSARKAPVAVIGSGNIGTDLAIKIATLSEHLDLAAVVGIDPESEGLARARALGAFTTAEGIDGLRDLAGFDDLTLLFDATSASAHPAHAGFARDHGLAMVDLTPAALGPFVVPAVNLADHLGSPNLNMVTCGGQATVPIVHAVNRVASVVYAEIVAAIASKSAGPGTRANIDEFTETTSRALSEVGGADVGKAIIVLNPASPPLVMTDTVVCLTDSGSFRESEVVASVEAVVADVRQYVPGYRLKQAVQCEPFDGWIPALDRHFSGHRVTVYLEVSGAGHFLPEYAGNLDIMTSAAMRTGEQIVLQGGRG